MKIKFRKCGPTIHITIQLKRCFAAPVYLCWRNGNTLQEDLLDILDSPTGEIHLSLLLSNLSATHFIRIITPTRTYNRFIPAKYLNLSSEHE